MATPIVGDPGARDLDRLMMDLGSIPKSGPLILDCVGANDSDGQRLIESIAGMASQRHDWAYWHRYSSPRPVGGNVVTFGQAASWLSEGKAVVHWDESASDDPTRGDPPPLAQFWESDVLRLANASGASVVPAAVQRSDGQTQLRVGSVVPNDSLKRLATLEEQAQLMRWRRRALHHRVAEGVRATLLRPMAEIVEPVSPALIAEELGRLPAECLLFQDRRCRVYVAKSHQIPRTLREIGRLRELTFRHAGEGTGTPIDLDRFDEDYYHLFVYCPEEQQIAGAYRLGCIDELLSGRGLSGLYTNTLFEYGPAFFGRLGPAIEVGRSFVRPEFQRTSKALLWLWKGIGQFVARRGRYTTLLGPVSVSADYVAFSRQLMVQVLSGRRHAHELSDSVRARNPLRARSFGDGGLGDPAEIFAAPTELSATIADAEHDRKGLPTLIREYLKLGGRFLSFNVDPDFSDVVDGLVAVNLLETDRRLLGFYMGAVTLQRYLECNGVHDVSIASR